MMEMEQKFSRETMDKVEHLKYCLDNGLTIDQVIKKMKLSEEEFMELYELTLSESYLAKMAEANNQLLQEFQQQLEEEEKRITEEKEKRKSPLAKLSEEEIAGASVFAVDYTAYKDEVRRYCMGTLEEICKRFWVDFTPGIPEEEICKAIVYKMRFKGIGSAKNPRLISPGDAVVEYSEMLNSRKKNQRVLFEIARTRECI